MLPLIVDAHEDLAYNILNYGRDYSRSAVETRQLERESGSPIPAYSGDTLLGWSDYQRGRVAIVFSTLFGTPVRRSTGPLDKQAYADYNQAHRVYRGQLDTYRKMVDDHPDKFNLIASRADLKILLADWADPGREGHPVGLVPLMEGAEGVRSPAELIEWWQWGVRMIGPAWAGTRYCGGTYDPGPLTDDGLVLLKEMAQIGFTLDLSHMDELSVLQALDIYPAAVIASHANAAALVPGYSGNRLLSDKVIEGILKRDGIIGVIPFCRFLNYEWKLGDPRDSITLETLVSQIDHICQMAGDALHVGLGTDFDGGFGLSAAPADVDTIADLQKLAPILSSKGYTDDQVAAVLGKNWLGHLETTLP